MFLARGSSVLEGEILLTVVRLMQGSSSNKQQLKLGFDTLKRLSNIQVPDESTWLGILEEFQFKAMRLSNYKHTESVIGGVRLFSGITLFGNIANKTYRSIGKNHSQTKFEIILIMIKQGRLA